MSPRGVKSPPPWKPLLVRGRWMVDEWGVAWLQAAQVSPAAETPQRKEPDSLGGNDARREPTPVHSGNEFPQRVGPGSNADAGARP